MTEVTLFKNVAGYVIGGFCAVVAIAAWCDHEDAERRKIREEAYAEGEEHGKWKILDDIESKTKWHGERTFEYIVKDRWSDGLKRFTFKAKQISENK